MKNRNFILEFNDFILQQINERISLSNQFYEFLKFNKKSSPIVNYLLSLNINDYKGEDKLDIDTIDINTEANTELVLKSKSRGRQISIKAGKAFRRLLDLINANEPIEYTDKDIEDLVNKYKAYIDNYNQKFRFEILKGGNIKSAYLISNYAYNEGQLGNSCMNDRDFFEIYEENPDKVSILVLFNEHNKILGRALLWNLDVPKIPFMDRVYCSNDSDLLLFYNWAYVERYYYKNTTSYGYEGKIFFNRKEKEVKYLSVTLSNFNFKKYPYLDTLRHLNITTGELATRDLWGNEGEKVYTLTGITGRDFNIVNSDERDGEFDVLTGDLIMSQDAVWSNYHNGYVDVTRSDVNLLDYIIDFIPTWSYTGLVKYPRYDGNAKLSYELIDVVKNKSINIVERDYIDFSHTGNDVVFSEASEIDIFRKHCVPYIISGSRNGNKYYNIEWIAIDDAVYSKENNLFYPMDKCEFINNDWRLKNE